MERLHYNFNSGVRLKPITYSGFDVHSIAGIAWRPVVSRLYDVELGQDRSPYSMLLKFETLTLLFATVCGLSCTQPSTHLRESIFPYSRVAIQHILL